jgi:L-fuculose-phosphate aldolase
MNYKAKLVEAGLKLSRSGLTVETWGNISIIDREQGVVYITPSGMPYDKVTEDDMVGVDLAGKVIEGERKPSVEMPMHVAIFNARKDAGAVLHTHSLYATAFASMGEDIPPIIDEAAQTLGGTVRTTEYALPATKKIAEQCIKALGKNGNACLLKSHGAVCIGESLEECFKVAVVLETTARIYYLIRSMGGKYATISEENIALMRDFALHHYGQK